MDEAGAVEEDVDRSDLARQRPHGVRRAHVELARLGVEASEPGDVDVGRDDARALPREGLGRRAPDARRGRRQQRRLARQSSSHRGRSFHPYSRGRSDAAPAQLLGDIPAHS